MSADILAFRLPGTPPPKKPLIHIRTPPVKTAEVMPFLAKPSAPAIPRHEIERRVRRVLRLAAEWDIGHLVVAVGRGGEA